MKILLTGASGFLGQHISSALQATGHTVIPGSRARGLDFNSFLEADDWLPHLRDIKAVINCVGIIAESRTQTFMQLHSRAPIALFRACERAGIRRVIQISALGSDASAITDYHKSKKSADDVLRSLSLDWFVLRPSLVYGTGSKSLVWFRRMAMLPVIPQISFGHQLFQPVHISDLVAAVLACLMASPTQQTIDIVGPTPMTFVDWLQRIRRANGKAKGQVCSLPVMSVIAIAHVTKYFSSLLNPDNIRMLLQGNVADVQDFSRLIRRMPVSVEDCDDEVFQ